MASRPSSVTASRKALEARLRLTCDTMLANVKATLESEQRQLLKEFDERLLLAAQLPGMDLSAYDVVQKFEFDWIYKEPKVCMLKIQDQGLVNVTVEPQTTYEGFFLWRKKARAEEKKA